MDAISNTEHVLFCFFKRYKDRVMVCYPKPQADTFTLIPNTVSNIIFLSQ